MTSSLQFLEVAFENIVDTKESIQNVSTLMFKAIDDMDELAQTIANCFNKSFEKHKNINQQLLYLYAVNEFMCECKTRMRKDFEFSIEDTIEQWIEIFDEYSDDYRLFDKIDQILSGWSDGKFFNPNTMFKLRSTYFHKKELLRPDDPNESITGIRILLKRIDKFNKYMPMINKHKESILVYNCINEDQCNHVYEEKLRFCKEKFKSLKSSTPNLSTDAALTQLNLEITSCSDFSNSSLFNISKSLFMLSNLGETLKNDFFLDSDHQEFIRSFTKLYIYHILMYLMPKKNLNL